MLCFEARIAKTDAFLLSTVVFAQAALATLWIGHREERPTGWAAPLVFWVADRRRHHDQGAGDAARQPAHRPVALRSTIARPAGSGG